MTVIRRIETEIMVAMLDGKYFGRSLTGGPHSFGDIKDAEELSLNSEKATDLVEPNSRWWNELNRSELVKIKKIEEYQTVPFVRREVLSLTKQFEHWDENLQVPSDHNKYLKTVVEDVELLSVSQSGDYGWGPFHITEVRGEKGVSFAIAVGPEEKRTEIGGIMVNFGDGQSWANLMPIFKNILNMKLRISVAHVVKEAP